MIFRAYLFFHSLRYTVTCDGARVLYGRDGDNFNCTSIENIVHLTQSGYTKAHAQKMDPYVAPGRFLSLEDKPKFPFCDEVCKIEMLSQERVKKRAALHPDMS